MCLCVLVRLCKCVYVCVSPHRASYSPRACNFLDLVSSFLSPSFSLASSLSLSLFLSLTHRHTHTQSFSLGPLLHSYCFSLFIWDFCVISDITIPFFISLIFCFCLSHHLFLLFLSFFHSSSSVALFIALSSLHFSPLLTFLWFHWLLNFCCLSILLSLIP